MLTSGVAAQAPALPPNSPLFGRPNTEAAMRLAPIVAPAAPASAASLAGVAGKLKLQRGFRIEVYAAGIAHARSLRQGDKGTVFVGSRLHDKVHAIVEAAGRREVKVIASGLNRPHGIAFKDGTLYIAELSQLSKMERIEDNLDNPPQPTVISRDLPRDEPHASKFLGMGPDNRLYVSVALPCNNCLPPDTHGLIQRMNLDGSGAEVVAKGVRNAVGFDWHPVSKELYFTDTGRDWVSEDFPEDELNRVTRPGQHFGAPFCYQGDFPDTEFGWGHSCDEFEKPLLKLGAHADALGMRFYTAGNFPPRYRNAIFIARHGSWNRTRKLGGDILAVFLNPDGKVRSTEVFITGFIGPDNNYLGRPADVMFARDGSMLISDDYNGAIWRVTADGPRGAATK